MRICELLQESAVILAKSGIETPEIDSELLLGFCLGKSRTELYLAAQTVVDPNTLNGYRSLLQRRADREPLAYILGFQEFWSLDFTVSPAVLIPRPETEQLLETVIRSYQKQPFGTGAIADLCCGSGVIAVVLAKELQREVVAIDISLEALRITKENCDRHGVSHLVSLVQSDLLSGFLKLPQFACVVSNPPYVSREEMDNGLQIEVEQYEPHLALDGGKKGLEVIERIRNQLTTRLSPGGKVFMEIGADQGQELNKLFTVKSTQKQTFNAVSVQKDYAGHDRIFQAQLAK